jgi:hypothetical protein
VEEDLKFHDGGYWRRPVAQTSDRVSKSAPDAGNEKSDLEAIEEGPFCPQCWEVNRKAIRGQILLVSAGAVTFRCDNHSTPFEYRVPEHLIKDVPLDSYRETRASNSWRPRYL